MKHHRARVMLLQQTWKRKRWLRHYLQLLAGRRAAGRLGGGDAATQEGGLLQRRLQSRPLLLCSAITTIGFRNFSTALPYVRCENTTKVIVLAVPPPEPPALPPHQPAAATPDQFSDLLGV